jgi:hypothetical protein
MNSWMFRVARLFHAIEKEGKKVKEQNKKRR